MYKLFLLSPAIRARVGSAQCAFRAVQSSIKWDDPNEYERRFRWVRSRNNASFDLHTLSLSRQKFPPPLPSTTYVGHFFSLVSHAFRCRKRYPV